MRKTTPIRPVVLCILDGWGESGDGPDDAIARAKKPVWDRLTARCPRASVDASELHVGLPVGQMGNSEVGHMNIGAGRLVMQDLPRIDAAVASGELGRNEALLDLLAAVKRSGGALHLIGLLSPGGVHSHQAHIAALARLAAEAGVPVRIHALLDGRDTPPASGRGFVATFLADISGLPNTTIATLGGRYFGMDRDQRWERLQQAYDVMVMGEGPRAADADSAISAAYARNETDEFVTPVAIGDYAGMKDGDGVLIANFRTDRVRQIAAALCDPNFAGVARKGMVRFAAAAGMSEISGDLNRYFTALFPAERLFETLGEVVARAGLAQLRLAETEKYAHVTFFFNGGEEALFPGEERVLVPSPRVATYDLKPEMSADEVADRLIEAILSRRFALIVVNFANTDMVGHTGNLAAATRAVEAVDRCLGRALAAAAQAGSAVVITADHGNAETMRDPATGVPHTAHTLNRVPIILANGPAEIVALKDGRLADIAPSVLALMGLAQPRAMTGHSLLVTAGPGTAP